MSDAHDDELRDSYLAANAAISSDCADASLHRVWIESREYWRLVWVGQITAGINGNPDPTTMSMTHASIVATAQAQADALVAAMFGKDGER